MASISTGSFNPYAYGNVSSYSKNLVNNYLANNKSASSSSLVSGFLNNATGTTQSTVTGNKAFATQNTTNLKLLQSTAAALSGAANKLGGSSQLVSSNDSVVKADKTSFYSQNNLSFNVNVQNLATTQKSASAGLASSASSIFETGKNNVTIRTEKGSYDIGFEVKSGDTNSESLNKLAQSINESKAGVTAKVVSENGKSSLEITSNETGEMSAFALEDAAGGSVAEKLSMSVERKAVDANYTVDGKNYSSASNTVTVPNGRGASMTLQGTGSASLEKGVDASSLVDAAQAFAKAYNSTVSHLMSGSAGGAGVTRALNLVANNRMTQMSMGSYGGYASSRLSAMGISINGDGQMSVDADKLTKAVKDSPATVKSTLSGYGGLAETARDNASKAMRIPTATYTNFSNMGVESSLISALMPKTGSMFDILL